MINSVNALEQDVAINGNVVFTTDRVRTRACGCGGWLDYETGGSVFTIARPGIYKVDFNANVTLDAAGDATLAIESNGEAVAGTEMDATIAVAGDFENISASTLIVVRCGSSRSISIGNLSATAVTVDDANIIITRIA